MDRTALNSSALNSAITGLVLATVSVVCAATVSAAGVRVHPGVSTGTSSAALVADATKLHTSVQVAIDGSSGLFPTPTHIKASGTSFTGSAEVVSYVLRNVPAFVTGFSGAEIIAVVASTQGAGTVQGTAEIVAAGTRIQAIQANLSASGELVNDVSPVLTRNGLATLDLGVAVRVEPSFIDVIDGIVRRPAYWDIQATANMVAVGVCYRMAGGLLDVTATSSPVGTIQQSAKAVSTAAGTVVIGAPFIQATLLSNLGGAALVTAQAVRELVGSSSITPTANAVANANSNNAASASLVSGNSVEASARILYYAYSDALVEANASATALRNLVGDADCVGSANMTGATVTNHAASAAVVATPAVTATAEDLNRRLVSSSAATGGTADATGDTNVLHAASSVVAVSGTCEAVEDAINTRKIIANVALGGTADFTGWSLVDHAGGATLDASATTVTIAEDVNTRRQAGSVQMDPAAELVAEGGLVKSVFAELVNTSELIAIPDVTVREVYSDLEMSVELTADPRITRTIEAVLTTSCEVTATALRTINITDIAINGTATLIADTVGNPEAFDPDERTFLRYADVTEFIRPYVVTEFERAA